MLSFSAIFYTLDIYHVGMVTLNLRPALALFDSGASFSFISSRFVQQHNISVSTLHYLVFVTTANGLLSSTYACLDNKLEIEGYTFSINLVMTSFQAFDLIIGMDWLSYHKAIIHFFECMVVFPPVEEREQIIFHGNYCPLNLCFLSSYFPQRWLLKTGSLYAMMEKVDSRDALEDMSIVKEFMDVFPSELPGEPPIRDVECSIDIIPRTSPIAKNQYRLSRMELEELKRQLDEL